LLDGELGDWELGDWELGDWELGDWELGDWELGDWELGDWELGDWAFPDGDDSERFGSRSADGCERAALESRISLVRWPVCCAESDREASLRAPSREGGPGVA
jgi:hypothetical protein